MKKVSIIIPAYNYARYLGECIESVLNQTYKNIEIIIVDDESTDNTKEIAAKYPVKYIWQKNKGLSGARNTGIKESTGEYLMMLDSDDKLVPGAIERHVDLMFDDKSIAQCALMEFGDRHMVHTPLTPTGLERILHSNTIFCNALFSKKVWEAVGGYDESEIMRKGWEDYEFFIRCLEYGCRVETSDFIALRYRIHSNSMTVQTTHPNWKELQTYIRTKHSHLYKRFGITNENIL